MYNRKKIEKNIRRQYKTTYTCFSVHLSTYIYNPHSSGLGPIELETKIATHILISNI